MHVKERTRRDSTQEQTLVTFYCAAATAINIRSVQSLYIISMQKKSQKFTMNFMKENFMSSYIYCVYKNEDTNTLYHYAIVELTFLVSLTL